MKYLLTAIAFLLILPNVGSAQKADYWQGGVFVGTTAFSGDVNPNATPDLNEISFAFGLSGRVDFTNKLGFKGSLIYGNFKGDDLNYEERQNRAFNFSTNVIEFVGIAEWEPFGADRYYTDADGGVQMDKLISPYLYAGAGLAFATLNTDYSGFTGPSERINTGIRMDRAEGNSKMAFVVPMGFGIKGDVSNHITLALDFGWRLVFSDHLDGISQSGNPDNDDIYFISGLTFYYRFFNN